MGRFYKTAKPTFVDDNMFDMPIDLMAQVIAAKDKGITKANDDLDEFDTLMQDLDNIQVDNPNINAALDGYRQQADALTKKIQEDAANYGKFVPQINSLKKNFQRAMQNGELGRANENFTKRAEEFARIDALENASDPRKAAVKQFLDTQYDEKGGLSYKNSEEYNKFLEKQINPEAEFDTGKFGNDLITHFAKDGTSYATSGASGGYITSRSGSKTFIKDEDLENYMENYLENSNFESTTRQKIMLDAYNNQGKRGEELDQYVEKTLEEKKKAFKEQIKEQVGFEIEGVKKNSTNVDAKALEDQRYLRKKQDEAEALAETKVYNDRRSNISRKADEATFNRINLAITEHNKLLAAQGLESPYSPEDFSKENRVKTLTKMYNSGKDIAQFLADINSANNNIFIPAAEIKSVIDNFKIRGDRGPLVPFPKNITPEKELQWRKEVKAIERAVQNQDLTINSKMVLSNDFGDYSSTIYSSPMELFNEGKLSYTALDGTQVVVNNVQVDAPADKSGAFYDSEGKEVFVKDEKTGRDRQPININEAREHLKGQGKKLKTIPVQQARTEVGNDPNLNHSQVKRFTSIDGVKDYYEQEFAIQVPVDPNKPNGNTMYKKVILQTPVSNVKLIK